MSFKEQRELEALPQRIEALEAEQGQIHETMTDPGFYKQDGEQIALTKARLEALEQELAKAYQRWELLEGLQGLA